MMDKMHSRETRAKPGIDESGYYIKQSLRSSLTAVAVLLFRSHRVKRTTRY